MFTNRYIHTYLGILLMSVLTLLACSPAGFDDGGGNGPSNAQGNRLLLSIGLALPKGSSGITGNPTGGEEGDGWRVGQNHENDVHDVCLYWYSSADGINASDETPVTLLAHETDVNLTYQASEADENGVIVKELEMNVGKFTYNAHGNDHFIVAINTDALGENTTLGKLRNQLISYTCRQTGSQIRDYDYFAMSNANESRFEGGAGSKENPYRVSVDVERITARIDFAYSLAAKASGDFSIQDGQYVYRAMNTEADKVFLTHVRATNVMQAPSYLIKRLAASETQKPQYLADEDNPATQYVVEPTTWSKTVQAVDDNLLDFNYWFRDSWYKTAVETYDSATSPWFRDRDRVHCGSGNAFTNGTSLDEKEMDWQYYVLDYANENTMRAEHTLHHYTTGMILKATYLPEKVYGAVDADDKPVLDEAYAKGKTFWRWHDVDTNEDLFFSNEEAALAYQNLHAHSVVFPYTDAQCYYNVWLRHENIIDDPTTTMMEFGIVRNNIYRVCVEFTGIGMPDIPDDMTTPETIRMYIYVRKWNLIEHPEIQI